MENEIEIENEQTFPVITLSKIVGQVSDALHRSNDLIISYQDKLKLVKDREIAVIDRENILAKQINDFSIRESEVSKVENVVSLKSEADKLIIEGKNIKSANDNDRKSFESYKSGETSRLNELRLTVQRESDNVLEARKQIDEEVSKRVSEVLVKMGIKKVA